MRHGRSKAARRTLQFFARTAGITPPFHVLLDGTFLAAVVKYKFPLRERLDKVLQHAFFTLYTTESCLEELGKLKQASSGDKAAVFEEAIQWAKNECNVMEDIPEFDKQTNRMLGTKYPELDRILSAPGFDILKLALHANSTNKATKYFVACQDETVLDVLRRSGAVPCIRLARGSVLLLENPSKSGQIQASHDERKKWSASGAVGDKERHLVDIVMEEKRKQRRSEQQPAPIQTQRKKRRAKEPNPLSCKKSKNTNEEPSSKRRRKRKTGAQES